MNIKQIEKTLTDAGIEPNEAKIEAKMLLAHYLKMSNTEIALNEEFEESGEAFENFINAVNIRVSKRIPVQYIIGSAYFMGEDFIVNDKVLIPRDETELLVRKATEIIDSKQEAEDCEQKVLDIGTGSGCIACMIAKLTCAQVVGVDISTEALQVALDNSSKMELFNKAIFRKSDVFSNVRENEKFDLIISNPPYIPISEKSGIQLEVTFEPETALFARDAKGVGFYQKIIEQSPKYLKSNGYLMFELGINQSELVKSFMINAGFVDIEIEKDLAYIDRIIYGRYQ